MNASSSVILAGIVGLSLLSYWLFRSFLSSRTDIKKLKIGGVKEEQSDFVMKTFQDLIRQLKDKEEVLEAMRKAAEAQADRVGSFNEEILQSVPSGVLSVDCDKIITTFNKAAGIILDLSPEQTLRCQYQIIFAKSRKMIYFMEETLRKQQDMLRQECEIDRSDGKKIWIGLNTSLLRGTDGQIIGVTLVFTDLTEKKLMEEQIALKKRLTMMGEMSAWIAHEFRNYTGTILGFSRLLEKRLEADDEGLEMISEITDELYAMEHLITELLSYSKKREINATPVALPVLIEKVIKPFLENKSYAQIDLRTTVDNQLPMVELDPTLMRQAFSNLIQNGLEVVKEGGLVHLSVLRRSNKKVQIEVKDNGSGISKEVIGRVLLPFFTTKENGTGLGLALAHKIVLSHNGHMEIESLEGSGTTVTIVLPIHQNQ
jgi:two-component system, NtrC family, sensor histidine kinase AtoS